MTATAEADVAAATGVPSSQSGARPWGALAVLLVGVFITTLDFFIVNVTIPAMQVNLQAGPAAIQFVVAGFAIALAASLITGGRLGDLYGRRKLYAIGLALFTLASAGCGLAPSAGFLIGARVVQGLAAALLMPQVLAILTTAYAGAQRAKAFTAFGLAVGLGGVLGQLIGGLLIQADIAGLGWRSVFLINVPVGLAGVALLRRFVPESTAPVKSTVDLVGSALVSLGLVAIVLPLVQGQQQGWPLWTWLCLGGAVVLLAAFVGYQRRLAGRGGSPLLNLTLFRERAFSAGLGISMVYALSTGSFFLVLALYLQQGHQLTALLSGLIFLPLGLGYFLASGWSAKAAGRLGRRVLTIGGLVLAVGHLVLAGTVTAIGANGSVAWLIPGLVLVGAGMGVVMPPLPAIVLAGIHHHHAAAASGVLNAAQQAGGALGVAVIGVVFYGTLGSAPSTAGFGNAFALSLLPLAAIGIAVAVAALLLPRAAHQD